MICIMYAEWPANCVIYVQINIRGLFILVSVSIIVGIVLILESVGGPIINKQGVNCADGHCSLVGLQRKISNQPAIYDPVYIARN